MEPKTKSHRTEALLTLFDMHTTFFKNVLDGISDKDAHNRLETKANHIAWLAGAIVQQRFYMAKENGSDLQQTGAELFGEGKGIVDNATYPTLEEYKKDWEKVTPQAREALMNVPDEKLDSILDMGGMKMKFYEMVSFTIYREANCIGQIALWRRLLDYPAMKYD